MQALKTPECMLCPPCRGPLDLAPWLYVTPAELAPFRDLLLRLGAREAFGAAQYAAVLSAMAARPGGQPLDPTPLAQPISIVQVCALLFAPSPQTHTAGDHLLLQSVVSQPKNSLCMQGDACAVELQLLQHSALKPAGNTAVHDHTARGIHATHLTCVQRVTPVILISQELSDLVIPDVRVWVPDERGVLTAAPDLVFNDAPWLGAQQEAAHFLHPKISFEARLCACQCVTFAGRPVEEFVP